MSGDKPVGVTVIAVWKDLNLQAVSACRREMSMAALGYSAGESLNAALMIVLSDMATLGLTKEKAVALLNQWSELNVTDENLKMLTPTREQVEATRAAHPAKVQRS
jgi:hypothetical protein